MIEKPITVATPELHASCVAYVLTLLRVQRNEPGMEELLATMHTRFTPDQFEVVEALGGEMATIFRMLAAIQGLDPIEALDKLYYPDTDWMPTEDYV